jgi:hypothetical protein
MLMKNSDDTIRKRTRNHPDCTALPQATAPPVHPEFQKELIFPPAGYKNKLMM